MPVVEPPPSAAVSLGVQPVPGPAPPVDHRCVAAYRRPPPVPPPTTLSARYHPIRNLRKAYRCWTAPAQPEQRREVTKLEQPRLWLRVSRVGWNPCCSCAGVSPSRMAAGRREWPRAFSRHSSPLAELRLPVCPQVRQDSHATDLLHPRGDLPSSRMRLPPRCWPPRPHDELGAAGSIPRRRPGGEASQTGQGTSVRERDGTVTR